MLDEPAGAGRVAQALADLAGCGRGVLLTSTLHLFWDLFAGIAGRDTVFCWETGLYPIARWGIERVAARGVPARSFPHHQPDGLRRLLLDGATAGRRPVVVADGVCAGCGRAAPLGDYLALARRHGGLLVIDDTQGFGLRGMAAQGPGYGQGGGGSLRAEGIGGPDIVLAASLAKAFGAPVAVLAGDDALVGRFARESEVRARCSPPSAAAIGAAANALAINAERGDALRADLESRVRRFRAAAEAAGLRPGGGLFPFQGLRAPRGADPAVVHRRLRDAGVRTVLQVPGCDRRRTLGFLITAAHAESEIDEAVERLVRCLGATS